MPAGDGPCTGSRLLQSKDIHILSQLSQHPGLMPRRSRKKQLPDNQMILLKAEASYPRRWQGIRSKRTYDAQVKGTMFERQAGHNQMELFGDNSEYVVADGGIE